MYLQALILVLAAGSLLATGDKKDEGDKKDPDKISGRWTAVSGERDGFKAPEAEITQITLEFKGDKMFILVGDMEAKQLANIKVDASKKPKTIDMELVEGPNKGKTSQGIYELDGDKLKLCTAKPGTDRPKEFATKKGSNSTFMVLKKNSL